MRHCRSGWHSRISAGFCLYHFGTWSKWTAHAQCAVVIESYIVALAIRAGKHDNRPIAIIAQAYSILLSAAVYVLCIPLKGSYCTVHFLPGLVCTLYYCLLNIWYLLCLIPVNAFLRDCHSARTSLNCFVHYLHYQNYSINMTLYCFKQDMVCARFMVWTEVFVHQVH